MDNAVFLRRTDLTDAPGIARLVTPETEKIFGNINVVAVIEKAVLSITAVDSESKIIGHLALYDDPGIVGVDAACWEEILPKSFQLDDVRPANTLFLRLLVTESGASREVYVQLLRTMFSAVPDLQYCLIALAAGLSVDELHVADWFTQVLPAPGAEEVPFTLHQCAQRAILPPLRVRNARVEDYDDLLPIFNRQSEMLIARHGEFFLANLIEGQNELNLALVAEVDGVPVGFLATSTRLNVPMLQRCFSLDALNNLQSVRKREVVVKKPATQAHVAFQAESTEEQSRRQSKAKQPAVRTSVATTSRHSLASKHASSSTSIMEQPAEEETTVETIEEWVESAFCITLFCMDEQHETRGLELLATAFERMHERSFCVLALPPCSAEMPLLTNFTHVPPVTGAVLPQELYVLHRSALPADITVQTLTTAQLPEVEKLVSRLRQRDAVHADVQRFLAAGCDPDGTKLYVHAILFAGQVVGVSVLRSARDDAARLRAHYNLEEFILFAHYLPGEHAVLHHFVLNPIFDRFQKYALREVMRKSKISCVYYRFFAPGEALADVMPSTLTPLTDHMVPVKRRRQIVYPLEVLGSNAPSTHIRELPTAFALVFLARKLMLEPKITVNARVVVVGASDTGLSFLETLAFRPHLRFNNLTLVSRHGLAGEDTDIASAAAPALTSSMAYSPSDRKQVAWQTWVNVVTGKMVALRRDARELVLDDGSVVPYDHLILTPGLQYPVALGGPTVTPPVGVFPLCDAVDARALFDFLAQHTSEEGCTAVIYGSSLDAYAAVNALLARNISGLQVILATPPGASALPALVESAIASELEKAGVRVMKSLSFVRWRTLENEDFLHAVEFKTAAGSRELVECEAFVNLSARAVDSDTFRAISDAFLVFDGRLVTDSSFCTTDKNIFAAGPAVKFSRKYFADALLPERCNSKELGEQLAQSLLSLLDPLSARPPADPPVPTCSAAKIEHAVLPSGLTYLHFHRPRPAAEEEAKKETRLVTRVADGDDLRSVCEVVVDGYGVVEALTCLVAGPLPDAANLVQIYGLHEKYLNRLLSRYREGLVKDFLDFFRASWVLAVFHDRFHAFAAQLYQSVKEAPTTDLLALEAGVQELAALSLLDQSDEVSQQKQQELREQTRALVDQPATSRLVKDRLMDFLTYNAYLLPNYARPGMW